MTQLGFFEDSEPDWMPRGDGLRYYQRDCVEAVQRSLRQNNSALVVMATGTGKTQVGSQLFKEWDGPCLWLAHRDELIDQAAERIEVMTGEYVDVEKADLQCSPKSRIVIGSVASVRQPNRLERMGRDRFTLICIDEAHHAPAKSYTTILDFFKAKHFGLTATPDRTDEKAMGKVYDDVAYLFDIEEGIDQGYLVPIRGQTVEVSSIDLSEVSASRSEGGLNLHELDDAMVKAVEGIVHKTLELEPGRRGISFWPGVRSAEYAMHAFNRRKPGSCAFVSGKTPTDERRRVIEGFRSGQYQFIANCGVLTEGFDAPGCDLIIHGRPTKSRSLYAQMTGRGTRPAPGCIDPYKGSEGAQRRRDAVAASPKPDLMLLDFVGNSGKHSLMTATDVLGGNYSTDEVALAKKKAEENPGSDQKDLLKAARDELIKLAQRAKVNRVQANVHEFDPFKIMGMRRETQFSIRFGDVPISDKQRSYLKRQGVPDSELDRISKGEAMKLIGGMARRRELGLVSLAQANLLKKHGVTNTNVSFTRGKLAIDYIASKGWGRTGRVDPHQVHHILYRERQMGED